MTTPGADLRRARLTEMAQFVIVFGITPAQYWTLTLAERDALVTEYNRIHRRR